MLPGLIAGHYGVDNSHIDTGPLARFAGARLYQDEVIDLDLAGRRVICRGRPPVPYDLLSLNIGSTPNTADVPGADEHAIPVKPIDGFLRRFEALDGARARAPRAARAWRWSAPVPAASSSFFRSRTGCEGEVARFGIRNRRTVVRPSSPMPPKILPSFPSGVPQAFRSRSRPNAHCGRRAGRQVIGVEAGRLVLDGRPRRSKPTRSCGPRRRHRRAGWRRPDCRSIPRGFLRVDATLARRRA